MSRIVITSDSTATPWIAVIAAARTVLTDNAGKGNALDITLSESFYRLGLIDAGSAPFTASELALVAQHHFRAELGDTCADCDFRTISLADNEALLCCAIESQGINGLQQAAAAAGFSIRSLRPRLTDLAPPLLRELTVFSGHLVIADARTALLISLRNGRWLQVMTRRSDPSPDWLATTLDQAETLTGTGSRTVWRAGSMTPDAVSGWQVRRLDASMGQAA